MSRCHHVLIVGHDRAVLGQLSRLLHEFGYTTRVTADPRTAEQSAALAPPDILIAESAALGPDGLARCQAASRHDDGTPAFTFVLTDAQDPRELKKAVEKGADDFLLRPLVWGEVLARLRAATRVIELERRLRETSGVDRLTGLATRTRFVALLDEALREGRAGVVVLHVEGAPGSARRPLVVESGQRIAELCGRNARVARLGDGRFAVVRADEPEDKVTAWAERASAALGVGSDSRRRADDAPWMVSAGVAVGSFPPAELLAQAEAACEAAIAAGGNLVLRYAQACEAEQQWQALRLPGRLFELTTARDVMLPCVVTLSEDESIGSAKSWLDRMGRDGLPVVDEQGALTGWVRSETLDSATDGAQVGEVADPDVPTCDEGTRFTRLMELFTSDGRSEMIVLRGGKPVGVLTRSGLAALIEPADRTHFGAERLEGGTRDLLVPDTLVGA